MIAATWGWIHSPKWVGGLIGVTIMGGWMLWRDWISKP